MKYRFFILLFCICLIAFGFLLHSSRAQIQDDDPQDPVASAQPTPEDDGDLGSYIFNVASQAYASSSYPNGNFPASAMVNRERRGIGWGAGTGGWADGTPNQFPDFVEIHLNGIKSIEEVDIYTVQDNYHNPVEPNPEMTFSLYGIVDFDVSYWNSSTNQWVLLNQVRGNNKVWWQMRFPPVTTSKISIVIHRAISGNFPENYSRITEVEVWGKDGIAIITAPLGPPDNNNPDPCQGKINTPCAVTIALHDAIKGVPLRYTNYRGWLDWNFQNWTNDSSKNLPVLAHAVTLWRPRSEWNVPPSPSKNAVQWWLTFLNCQVGDPACPSTVPVKLKYMKSDEVLSNDYDADTTRAIVSAFHWASLQMLTGNNTAEIADLAFKSRLYLRKTWGMYTLGAGYGPAASLTHKGNRDFSSAQQRCQRSPSKYWYKGPFMALAGMRSPWSHQCQEDRGPIFTRALSPEWPNALPSNAPADLRIPVIDTDKRETSAQWALLDLIQLKRNEFASQPGYQDFPYKTENAYALSPELRAFLVEHIAGGGGSDTIIGALQGTKLSVEYHFLAWTDSGGRQVRMTVMRKNTNAATIPTYAVLYRADDGTSGITGLDRTAEAMIPFAGKSLTMQEYLNWQRENPSSTAPERAPRLCYRNDTCYANKDYSAQCYLNVNELGRDWEKCWTRQERGPGINDGYALLLNNSSETVQDFINPTRLKVSNLANGENPNIKHGRIIEWINPLGITTRLYHIAYIPNADPSTGGTWIRYW